MATSTGDIGSTVVSAAVGLVTGLFKGHSEWWYYDTKMRDGDYNGVLAIAVKWYSEGGVQRFVDPFTDNGGNVWKGLPRYKAFPQLYSKTGKQEARALIDACISAGLLSSSALPPADYIKTPVTSYPVTNTAVSAAASNNVQGQTQQAQVNLLPYIVAGFVAVIIAMVAIFKRN